MKVAARRVISTATSFDENDSAGFGAGAAERTGGGRMFSEDSFVR